MKFKEMYRTAKEVPAQIKATTNLIVMMAILVVLSVFMSGMALVNSGNRHAN